MARTKIIPKKRISYTDFDLGRVTTAKKIGNRRGRITANNVKIKVLLPQSKEVKVKKRGQIIRRMRVRRKTIFPAKVRNRTYG